MTFDLGMMDKEILQRKFFDRPALLVARQLLGAKLIRVDGCN